MKTLCLKLFVVAAFSIAPVAYGHEHVFDLPGIQNATNLSTRELALRIRVLSHDFIEVVPWIRGGRLARTLRDESRVIVVTRRNIDHWERVFATRLETLKAVARARGRPHIDGAYSVRIEPRGCILPGSGPESAVVAMRDVEFDIKFSPDDYTLSGVAIGEVVDLPLWGGNQRDPFFYGSSSPVRIHLRNKNACEFTLVRSSGAGGSL